MFRRMNAILFQISCQCRDFRTGVTCSCFLVLVMRRAFFYTLGTQMDSLSTCHLGVFPWMTNLLNLVKYSTHSVQLTLANSKQQ